MIGPRPGCADRDSQLKDIQAELQGWGQAIRCVIADGTAAARVALDPRARDRLRRPPAARRLRADGAADRGVTPNHNRPIGAWRKASTRSAA